MGLDARVHCDCFERGRLRTPPPAEWQVHVATDGSLEPVSEYLETDLAFDQWYDNEACEHEGGVLLHHRLGNIALIAAIRSELEQTSSRFPVLIGKVVYSGMHCGDHLSIEDIHQLRPEIDSMKSMASEHAELTAAVRTFAEKMEALVACALGVGKPIVF